MKSKGILNRDFIRAIADMGHEQIIIIGDAGVPISDGKKRIDLAIAKDLPSIDTVLELLVEELIYEKVIIAEEQKKYNPNLFKKISTVCERCEPETVPHKDLFETYLPQAKYIVRTGSFEPWGNVVLVSGIDAPKWFEKPGCEVPDYYEERANYGKE